MSPDYKFFISKTIGGETRLMHPDYKDDLALEYAFEGSQYFRRASLSGSLTFLGVDFDYFNESSINDTFYIEIQVDYNRSGVYSIIFSGMFNKTDCTFNADDKKCTVKPRVNDQYNKILAGLDKEYDLIKLTPAIQPVRMIRRPMLQIYVPNEDIVSCFVSGMAWEQDANSEGDSQRIIDYYHFGLIGTFTEMNFPNQSYFSSPFVGNVGAHSGDGEWDDFGLSADGLYRMTYYQNSTFVAANWWSDINGVRIYRVSDNTLMWQFEQQNVTDHADDYSEIPDTFTAVSLVSGYNDIEGEKLATEVFGRWCTAKYTSSVSEIPFDDIVPYNRNYKYCIPYDGSTGVIIYRGYSNDPTEWGIRPDGKYYSKPVAPSGVLDYFPVGRSMWNYSSLWFVQTTATEQMEQDNRKDTDLKDAFTLEAVINALLSQIDNTITFAASTTYSQFLYGTNPFMNNWGRLVMTPKSNVLVAEYTQPARKAPITLGKVLNMLKNACGCYWYIDGSNRLRIEHIAWFKNGGSYNTPPVVGIDVTAVKNIRNGKAWTFGTNEWSYDKIDMPERYQYAWMDDTTTTFKGDAIEVLSPYVQEGKIEDINIDGFNSDLDYMMLNPSNVSEEGFALLNCYRTGNIWRTQIGTIGDSKVQNWQLAFPVLQPNFLISDMPAWNIKVNGVAMGAQNIQRKKKQKIDYPCGQTFVPDLMKVVKTGVGTSGEIEKLSLKLLSRMATINLRFTTG